MKSVILLSLFFFICFFVPATKAATISAENCSQSAVQAAVNSASNGDTVLIPAGDCTWTSGLSLSKAITLQGAGRDSTYIRSSVPTIIAWEVGHSLPTRITGITFDGLGGSGMFAGVSTATGSRKNTNFRVDNNRFMNIGTGLRFGPGTWVYGVVDNNLFENCNRGFGVYGDKTASWTRGGDVGTADALYIEDNTFTFTGGAPDHCIEASSGARYVFRYNMVTTNQNIYDPIDAHGYCSNGVGDGTYLVEIYNNNLVTTGSGRFGRIVNIRGGRGVVFNNTLTGSVNEQTNWIHLIEYRTIASLYTGCMNADACPQGNLPCPKTYCPDTEGYPCTRQINNLYIWNNTKNGVVSDPGVDAQPVNPTYIVKDRDYFTYAKPGYTPYTYPHPLRMEPKTCSSLGGNCCLSGQTCPGTAYSGSSDCSGICCSVTCAPAPIDVIIDNTDPGFSETGTWSVSGYPNYYGTNSLWADVNQGSTATWTPNIDQPGIYSVYAWWTAGKGRINDAKYTITSANGQTVVTKDQKQDGGQWNLLENFTFNAGTSGFVIVNDSSTDPNYVAGSVSDSVCADAVGFVYIGQSSCIHKAEIPPCNGCVSNTELSAFINLWYLDSSNPTLKELIEAIGWWKRGC